MHNRSLNRSPVPTAVNVPQVPTTVPTAAFAASPCMSSRSKSTLPAAPRPRIPGHGLFEGVWGKSKPRHRPALPPREEGDHREIHVDRARGAPMGAESGHGAADAACSCSMEQPSGESAW